MKLYLGYISDLLKTIQVIEIDLIIENYDFNIVNAILLKSILALTMLNSIFLLSARLLLIKSTTFLFHLFLLATYNCFDIAAIYY
jgi:hypothetical protein